MTALVKKQNKYLHDVYAISFINMGLLKGNFFATDALRKGSKRKNDDSTQVVDMEHVDQEMENTVEKKRGGNPPVKWGILKAQGTNRKK